MKNSIRALALLLASLNPLSLAASIPQTSTSPATLLATRSVTNPPNEYWAIWLVRGAVVVVGDWLVGKVVDAGMDRLGVKRVVENGLRNAFGIAEDRNVPPEIRDEMRRIAGELRQYHALLARNELNDRQVRAQLNQLHRDFAAHVRETDRRLAAVESRIARLEQQQREQYRMIVDLQRRVTVTEGRIVSLEGRVDRIERNVDSLNAAVFVDPNRFLRHDAYLLGALLYANSPALGDEAAIGGELGGQYNFNQYLGVFGGLAYMPLSAADVDSMPAGSAVTWDNLNLHLGAVASLLDPRSPVSFQVGAGGGIASSRLLFYDAGVERTTENAEELGRSSNVYMLVKGEIGVAPPAYTFEPVATVGYITFLEDVAYSSPEVTSNVGRSVWFVSLGLRMRHIVRGGPRRDVLSGRSGN
ncbi:MAG TPA: hypothetical protein VGB24_25030 [Longimicrobium sp.]|jgi:hypothetical protein|uniref:hypothetical protein n=1 Tax=Longimicrobium sp. TaxID=2029185 RepID=UPI002EDB7717